MIGCGISPNYAICAVGSSAIVYLSATLGIMPTRWVFAIGAIVASFESAECPVDRGMQGIFGKPLERAIWNTLGLHAVPTTCLRFSSCSDGACVACCLFLSTGSYHVCIQIHSTGCCFPRCTTETFWGCKLGAGERDEPGRKAKKPRTAGSRPPACTHKKHEILTTAEATSFASQFWGRKVQVQLQDCGKLKKYVPIHKHGDVCPNGVPARVDRGNDDDDSDSEQ